MNICYIADSFVPSRTANSIHVMKMCQAYASLGHRVTLVLPNWYDGIEPGVEDVYAFYGVRPEFTIRKIPIPRWRSSTLYFGVFLPLVALLSRPTLVHTRSLSVAWGMTNLFRISTMFEIHHIPYQNQRQQAFFERVIDSRYLRALITITHALADHVRPLLRKEVRLIVAPDGVDAMWLQQPLSPADARAKLGLSNETRRIAVYTGNLYRGRGVELIIELARHLEDHLFLVVGGQEADVARYREQASELPNLRFVGFVPPAWVPSYLYAADVLLMPHGHTVEAVGGSDISTFTSPIKMFEYMAVGRPIVASTLPVLQEVLQDGINALLIPYDQPLRWVEALKRLQKDVQFASGLGRQVLLDVKQYTWENRAQRLLKQIGCCPREEARQ
ncbi:MAG TPA: glycosyltransferase [Anaerolineae bacterium]|nr:glycosyltransferase [Anaerolineae bacterium]